MTLPEALPSYTYARTIDLAPVLRGSLSHLWNSFKTRFGTSVLSIASTSITDALVPRTAHVHRIYGSCQIYFCAFALNEASKTFLCNDMYVTF